MLSRNRQAEETNVKISSELASLTADQPLRDRGSGVYLQVYFTPFAASILRMTPQSDL